MEFGFTTEFGWFRFEMQPSARGLPVCEVDESQFLARGHHRIEDRLDLVGGRKPVQMEARRVGPSPVKTRNR